MHKNITKILLVNPPTVTSPTRGNLTANPPLGLAYIAAVLEKEKYTVRIIDALTEGWRIETKIKTNVIRVGLPFSDIKRRIADFNPDVVGVSCLFSVQHKEAIEICKITKEINKNIITVLGGAHPSCVPEESLKDKNVDFVVIGEGEYTFLELLKKLERGLSVDGLDGIAFRKDGQIKILPKTNFIANLDELPFPARHLLPMDKYFEINNFHDGPARNKRSTSIITSRGCPADCVFCSIHSVWGNKFRSRSPENVISEIRYLKDNYKIKELNFEDDNLTFDKNRAMEIFDKMIKEKLEIIWRTPNGVALWRMDDELLKKMKLAGCYSIIFGIESANEYVLKNIIKKPLDLKKVEPLVKLAKKIKLKVALFFVIGLPGETLDQIKDDFRLAKKLNVNSYFLFAMPYPGTRLYRICNEKGYLSKDFSYDNLINCYEYLTDKPLIETPDWNAEQLKRFFNREYSLIRTEYFLKRPLLLLNKVIRKPQRVLLGMLRLSKIFTAVKKNTK